MPDGRRPGLRSMGAALLLLAGCSQAPAPESLPPQTVTPQPASSAPMPSELPVPAAAPQVEPVVIDAGGPGPDAPRTLASAAEAERARRAEAEEPIAVITNETLHSYATGNVTTATVPDADPEAPPEETAALASVAEEDSWRRRARTARLRWREAADAVDVLELEIADLRRRFYAEDDPFYRDSRIKPAWDRALDRLRQQRDEIEDARDDLEALLEEGRRAGALPGWLRDGIELEPEVDPPAATAEPTGAEPVEPADLAEPPGGGR